MGKAEGWTAQAVSQTLREVSQLRALAMRLPRLPTPKRLRLASEFERFARQEIASCPPEALAYGLEALWEAGEPEQIVELRTRYAGPWNLEATTYLELAQQKLQQR